MRKAKNEGKRFGRPRTISDAQRARIIEMARSNQYSVRMIANAVNAPLATTQRVIKEAGDQIPPRARGRRFGTKMTKAGMKRKRAAPKPKAAPVDHEFI
jgi:DNA invertase Pin-like site-specific DNA recombinase